MNLTNLFGFAQTALPIILVLFVLFLVVRRITGWYKKVSPNTMAVISGRKHKINGGERGFRYIVGGGTLVIPLLEQMQEMSLNIMQIEASVSDVPDKDGVLITVSVNANVKIKSDDQSAPLAIERFLGMSEEEIKAIAQKTLEGNLRAVTGKLTIEELRTDRQKFMQSVIAEAGEDLGKMGLTIDGAQIQDIRDKRGYLDAIGKKKTAETVKDATIGEAEAHRDADVSSAAARQAGETAKAAAELEISNAQRDRDMGIADNEAKVSAQRAMIPIAGEIAAANRTAELNTAKVSAEKAEVTAGIELQQEQLKLNEARLEATTVTTARKNKDAKIIEAEGEQAAAVLTGEAQRIKLEKEGQGQQAKDTGIAQGRIQLASALQKEQEAEAAGTQAKLLADAAGKEADLKATAAGELAMADAKKAMLLAEAEGAAAKAKAFKELDEAGRFLMILQALPPVIEALGTALEKSIKPFAEAIGEGLGNIDEVRIIDMGGAQSGGQNLVTRFATLPAETMFEIVQKLKATNFWPVIEGLCKQAGIDVNALGTAVGKAPAAASEASA